MKPEVVLKPEFVEFIPEELNERTIYVAPNYRTVVHLCCCGCRRKVVTPLSPVSWKLTFDGVSITLHPSIGNWNLPCKSHYWIDNNRVYWAGRWTERQIESGRAAEERARVEYYGEELQLSQHEIPRSTTDAKSEGFWKRLWCRLFR